MMLIKSLILVFVFSLNCYAANLTITQGPVKRVLSDGELQNLLQQDKVEVDDPVYHKHKKYAGYWLMDIFKLAGVEPNASHVLVFTGMDGYKARITYSEVLMSRAKAFVAIKDLGATNGWQMIQQGKETISPAPFYLVWQVPANAPTDSKYPWPYQLVDISVAGINDAQDQLFPDTEDKTESIERGHKIFQHNCIACHSLNLEGGVLGPELNVPRNIMEYRDRKVLKEFIGDPSSFRAKSKMPSFKKILPEQSIEDVLDYLAWIGKHKIELRGHNT